MADTINILDLLSNVKTTSKIEKIARVAVNSELDKLEDKILAQLDNINKRLGILEKVDIKKEVSAAVSKGEDELRKIIKDEVGGIFFRLYVKRNSWQ